MAQYFLENNNYTLLKVILESHYSFLAKINFFDWFYNDNIENENILEMSINLTIEPKQYLNLLELILKYAKNDKKLLISNLTKRKNNIFHLAAKNGKVIPLLFYYENLKDITKIRILEIANISGMTPLHYSCYFSHKNIADILINLNCNLNIIDSYRQTPLHLAVSTGNYTLVKKLIISGADKFIRDSEGFTPRDIAKKNNFASIKELLSKKTIVSIKNNEKNCLLICIMIIILLIKFLLLFGIIRIYKVKTDKITGKELNTQKIEGKELITLYCATILDFVLFLVTLLFRTCGGNCYRINKTSNKNKKESLIELMKNVIFNPKNENVAEEKIIYKIEKLCPVCHYFKAASTKHCIICNTCVDNWDHHCFWLSRCVNKKNKKYFFLFIFLLTVNLLTNFAFLFMECINSDTIIYYRIISGFLMLLMIIPVYGIYSTISNFLTELKMIKKYNINDNEVEID